MQRLQQDFDTLFGRMWRGVLTPFDQDLGEVRLWDFNVSEKDNEIVVRAEVPGFEPDELDVQLNDDVLTIKAEKEQKGNGQEEYRSFLRSIALPPGINAQRAQATYRNGILELHIPRTEAAQPRRIQVQGGQATNGPQAQQPMSNQAGAAASQAGATASKEARK